MSMNLHLQASLRANTKLGPKKITESFGLWQTPTEVTRKCLASGDTLASYREWVLENKIVDKFPVYSKEDIFGEEDPIGYEDYCAADDHLERLDEWIQEHSGWKITWFEL